MKSPGAHGSVVKKALVHSNAPIPTAQKASGYLAHFQARGVAPNEGLLHSGITEEEAGKVDAKQTSSTTQIHIISTIESTPKGSQAWAYAKGVSSPKLSQESLITGGKVSSFKKPMARRFSDAKGEALLPVSSPNDSLSNLPKKSKGPPFRAPDNICSRLTYPLASSAYFDRFVLICIVINSAVLAMYNPRGIQNLNGRIYNEIPLNKVDMGLLIVFAIEIFVKINTYGVYTTSWLKARDDLYEKELEELCIKSGMIAPLPCHPRYLDESWNRLDFFIVASSIISSILTKFGFGIQNISVLRSFRMLRPLRLINAVPEMRVLIDSLANSAKPMVNIMLLCGFLILVFALIGQQMFQGLLTQRCFKGGFEVLGSDDSGRHHATFVSSEGTLSYHNNVLLLPDNFTTPIAAQRCGGDFSCPSGWECRISGIEYSVNNGLESNRGVPGNSGSFFRYANPGMGYINYDDIGHSLLNVFVAMSQNSWTDQLYFFQDSSSRVLVTIYFLLLVVFLGLFAVNLAVAVISDNFSVQFLRSKNDSKEKIEIKKSAKMTFIRVVHQEKYAEEQNKKSRENDKELMNAALSTAYTDSDHIFANAIARLERPTTTSVDGRDVESVERGEYPSESQPRVRSQSKNRSLRRAESIAAGSSTNMYRPRNCIRAAVFDVVRHPLFDALLLVCIFANTIILALPNYPKKCVDQFGLIDTPGCINQATDMIASEMSLLNFANFVLLCIFGAEVLLKFIGFGRAQYFSDRYSYFDVLIVSLGFMEKVLEKFLSKSSGGGIISAFRIFRLARVFKAARYWPSMQAVISTLLFALPSLGYLTLVMSLFMFIAATAGMHIFGNAGVPNSYRPNFNDFGSAMITVFQVLTGENWNEVMFVNSANAGNGYVLYFVFVFSVGNFVIMNLYLAILLTAFSCGEPPRSSTIMLAIRHSIAAGFEFLGLRRKPGSTSRGLFLHTDSSIIHGAHSIPLSSERPSSFELNVSVSEDTLSEKIKELNSAKKINARRNKADKIKKSLEGFTCGCISGHNRLRLFLARLVHNQSFDNFIMLFIVVSTAMLAIETPQLQTCGNACILYTVLQYADIIFCFVFLSEMGIKIIVFGLIYNKHAYLRDPWNILDGFIVTTSTLSLILSYTVSSSKVSWIRALRAIRALRPLRTIKRNPGMRLSVNTIFACAPSFLNIGLVAFVVYLIFAIIGVQFFGGRFWSCNDTTVHDVFECVGKFTYHQRGSKDVIIHRVWSNAPQNFDNTANALLTLFEVAGIQMFEVIMYSACDQQNTLGLQPRRNHNRWAALFFLVFIVLGSFLINNLFVGAVVDSYNNQTQSKDEVDENGDDMSDEDDGNGTKKKNKVYGSKLVTSGQKAFMASIGLIFSRKPVARPTPPALGQTAYQYRRMCYNFVQWGPIKGERKTLDGSYFEIGIIIIVVFNTIAMMSYSWTFPSRGSFMFVGDVAGQGYPETVSSLQRSGTNKVLDLVNNIFTIIFNIEMFLKLSAWGGRQYWADRWNRIDLLVVVIADVVFLLDSLASAIFQSHINPNLARILRLVKLLRILRVLSTGKEVIFLVETLVYAFPAISNVASLWFLVMFIYCVIGMSLYGSLSVTEPYLFGMYNKHSNFKSFGTGIITLFGSSTGLSWNGMMHDVMTVYPTAWVFFVSYQLIVTYLLFNLLVAIVLQQFNLEKNDDDENPIIAILGADHMTAFQDEWCRFDPYATQHIMAIELPMLLKRLPVDLSPLVSESSSADIIRTLAKLQISVDSFGQVHFAETYIALIRYAYWLQIEQQRHQLAESGTSNGVLGALQEEDISIQSLEKLMSQIVAHYPNLANRELSNKPVVEFFAASRLQALWYRAQAKRNWKSMLQNLKDERSRESIVNESIQRRRTWSALLSRNREPSSSSIAEDRPLSRATLYGANFVSMEKVDVSPKRQIKKVAMASHSFDETKDGTEPMVINTNIIEDYSKRPTNKGAVVVHSVQDIKSSVSWGHSTTL